MSKFNGSDYDPDRDDERLSTQIEVIFDLMKDGQRRTLMQIEELTGYGQASISAQLRHMTKEKHGNHTKNNLPHG